MHGPHVEVNAEKIRVGSDFFDGTPWRAWGQDR